MIAELGLVALWLAAAMALLQLLLAGLGLGKGHTELLAGVSQRYQPNIRMTTLANIKTGALPAATEVVTRVFEDACRYIPGHSQPLVTLGVSPTLPGLEAHWKELQDARAGYSSAVG